VTALPGEPEAGVGGCAFNSEIATIWAAVRYGAEYIVAAESVVVWVCGSGIGVFRGRPRLLGVRDLPATSSSSADAVEPLVVDLLELDEDARTPLGATGVVTPRPLVELAPPPVEPPVAEPSEFAVELVGSPERATPDEPDVALVDELLGGATDFTCVGTASAPAAGAGAEPDTATARAPTLPVPKIVISAG